MARHRSSIEKRFRRGSNAFIVIAALSAASTTALYNGLAFHPVRAFCLATPMVVESVVRHVDPRFFGTELRYYCYMFSLILAGAMAVLGLLTRYSSHAGTFFKVSNSMFKGFARLGSWFGIAHLVGSRLIYFSGIVLYTLDAVAAMLLENLIPKHIADLQLTMMLNLGFHLVMLTYLLFGFVAGLEREIPPLENTP